jgi:hypothetical protein
VDEGAKHKDCMFKRFHYLRIIVPIFVLTAAPGNVFAADNPFLGGWALAIPGGHAGWLGVEERDGRVEASLLWGGGSVVPLASARIVDGQLVLTRNRAVQRKDANGKSVKATITETITASVDGDTLKLSITNPRDNGKGEDKADFTGQRVPSIPPAPDLRKVRFGKAIRLFNGKDLAGWRLTEPAAVNGWRASQGRLVNEAPQQEGKPHQSYGNLRTDQEFEDFNLRLKVRVPPKGNSGVYLRGIYEVQVADTYGKPLDPHNMGAIYSRIKPTKNAEKPAGKWQTMDITLVERHVTVILNGKKIIDNKPLLGCTGGALWSDVTRPGPIYLQGDHTGIEYRNIVLKPVVR